MPDRKKKKEPARKVVQVTDLEPDEKGKEVKGGYLSLSLKQAKITNYRV